MCEFAESMAGDQLRAEDFKDPEVAAELARTAVANQLAILVIQYRVQHGLTQTALARRLGMRQPAPSPAWRLATTSRRSPCSPGWRRSWASPSAWT